MDRRRGLYKETVDLYRIYRDISSNKSVIEKIIDLISNGIKHDSGIKSILMKSNKQLSQELKTVKNGYVELKATMDKVECLERKLQEMNSVQAELSWLKRDNAAVRLKITPVTAHIWKMQEDLFNLRKEKVLVQEQHTEEMKKSRRFIELISKVLPIGKFLEYKVKIDKKSSILEKDSQEVESIKEELSRLVPIRDGLFREVESTMEKLPAVNISINFLGEKVQSMAPRVMTEEDEKKLGKDVKTMEETKEELLGERNEISPRIVSITEEEEKITTILDSYKVKNKRDSEKMRALKNDLNTLKIEKDTVFKLEDELSSIEGGLKTKRKEVENLKKELSQILDKNQGYKATIKEVEEGAKKLKKMVANKKKK